MVKRLLPVNPPLSCTTVFQVSRFHPATSVIAVLRVTTALRMIPLAAAHTTPSYRYVTPFGAAHSWPVVGLFGKSRAIYLGAATGGKPWSASCIASNALLWSCKLQTYITVLATTGANGGSAGVCTFRLMTIHSGGGAVISCFPQ